MNGYKHKWIKESMSQIRCEKCGQLLFRLHLQMFRKIGTYDVNWPIQKLKEQIQKHIPCEMSDDDFIIKEIIE